MPAHATVRVSEAMLNMVRWTGLRPFARSVHCAQALTVAMHTVGAGPSENSAQKFTACDSERFDWLRPSGRTIFAVDVAIASASNTTKSTGCGSCRRETATAKHTTPAARTAAT